MTFMTTILLLTSSCEPSEEPQGFVVSGTETVDVDSGVEVDGQVFTATEVIDCADLSADQNFFNIQYCTTTPSELTESFCFTEQELVQSLLDAGLLQIQIDNIIQTLFYDDTAPTGEFVRLVGSYLANILTLPPNVVEDCYRAWMGSSVGFDSSHGEDGCISGEIDNYGILSAGLGSNNTIIVSPASNNVTLTNICGGYPSTLDLGLDALLIEQMLQASGMTAMEANQTVIDMGLGVLSAREFYDLFQFNIIPFYPGLSNIPEEELLECWRISRIIFSVFVQGVENGEPIAFNTRYRIDGTGLIGCPCAEVNLDTSIGVNIEYQEEDFYELWTDTPSFEFTQVEWSTTDPDFILDSDVTPGLDNGAYYTGTTPATAPITIIFHVDDANCPGLTIEYTDTIQFCCGPN